MSRIVVAGASGVLGGLICREVARLLPAAEVVAGDHRPERVGSTTRRVGAAGGVHLDVRDASTLRRALDGGQLVVVAVGQDRPVVQEVCLELGLHSVDVGALAEPTASILGLDAAARAGGLAMVSMAGLYPGLSGLLAAAAAAGLDRVDRLEVLLEQSSNASVGRSGTVDMLRIVTAPVPHRGVPVRGFGVRRTGEPRMRLIDHAERTVLAGHLGLVDRADLLGRPGEEAVEYWTCWDSRLLTETVAGLARLRLLPRLARPMASLTGHDPAKPERVELRVRAEGIGDGVRRERTGSLSATSDYGVTAMTAASLARLALGGGVVGAGPPVMLTTFDAVLPLLDGGAVDVRLA